MPWTAGNRSNHQRYPRLVLTAAALASALLAQAAGWEVSPEPPPRVLQFK